MLTLYIIFLTNLWMLWKAMPCLFALFSFDKKLVMTNFISNDKSPELVVAIAQYFNQPVACNVMPFCNAYPLFYGCEIKGESSKMRNETISGRIVGRLAVAVVGFMTKNAGWFNQPTGSSVCYIHGSGAHLWAVCRIVITMFFLPVLGRYNILLLDGYCKHCQNKRLYSHSWRT